MTELLVLWPALLLGLCISVVAAPLGALVVWRNLSFVSDSLAHAALLGVALAGFVQLPSMIGMAAVCLCLIGALQFKSNQVPSDALLAGFSAVSLACGMLLLSQQAGGLSRAEGLLFGDLLATSKAFALSALLCSLGFFVWLVFRFATQVRLITNAELAQVEGVKSKHSELEFYLVVVGFTLFGLSGAGALLVTALLVLPALSVRAFSNSPVQLVVLATAVSVTAFGLGALGSFALNLPSGPSVVAVLAMCFLVSKAAWLIQAKRAL